MTEFIKRTLTGILFVTIVLVAVYFHRFAFFSLFLIITALGLIEFYRLAAKNGHKPQVVCGTIIGASLFSLSYIYTTQGKDQTLFIYILPVIIFPPILEIFRKSENLLINIALTYTGLIYVAIPFSVLLFIAFPENSSPVYAHELIAGYFILLWSFDTFAYLTGRLFGKHKMFESVSPGKTWEGFFGGFILNPAVAFIMSFWISRPGAADWIMISVIISVTGTLGDLLESAFKRSAGVKDSGRFLPGHGGILDRFDSALVSIPFVYFYISLFT